MKEAKIDLKRVTGASSDGASSMSGKNSGVMTKMKIVCPHLTSGNCGVHRVNLLTEGVFDKN